jgi:ubiquinone/menaquinone biosynthesis C-methylase UbiE
MNKRALVHHYQDFLKRTVGKPLSKKAMHKLDVHFTELFSKGCYTKKVASLWKHVVSYETKGDELVLFCKAVPIKPNLHITSVGSGLCVFELFLAEALFPQGKVACFDTSREMNKVAEQIKRKVRATNVRIALASATQLPLRTDSQDIVLARRTGLSSTKTWPLFLDEAWRVLRTSKDSRLIYTVQQSNSHPLSFIKQIGRAHV